MHAVPASLISIAALATVAAAQSSPGVITPLAPNNAANLGASVINRTVVTGETVASIHQLELRPLGGGIYRCAVTVQLSGQTDTKIVAGSLDMNTNPPVWTPNGDLEALNTANTAADEFQASLSADGLVVVWDNYIGTTYPNAAFGSTFVCRRASTAVPFSINDVRNIGGVASGGVDPHIGEELSNGHIMVYHLDANGDISRMDVDPATGGSQLPTLAADGTGANPNQTPGIVTFAHSPFVQRDSTGKARALTFSEYISGSQSDGLWQSNVDNTGNRWCIAKRDQNSLTYWFANPTVVGGTWAWATATGGYADPSMFEGNAVADANVRGGGRIVAYAPIRPMTPGVAYLSAIAIGTPASPPLQIPPVVGDVLIYPVGLTGAALHDTNSGIAEWIVGPYTPFNATYTMQVITLDVLTSTILAGNTATLEY